MVEIVVELPGRPVNVVELPGRPVNVVAIVVAIVKGGEGPEEEGEGEVTSPSLHPI